MWLWLWLGLWGRVCACSTPAAPEPSCPPARKEACRELLQLPPSFPATRSWCLARQTQLLRSWSRRAQGALRGQLDEGGKNWVSGWLEMPREGKWRLLPGHQDFSQGARMDPGAAPPPGLLLPPLAQLGEDASLSIAWLPAVEGLRHKDPVVSAERRDPRPFAGCASIIRAGSRFWAGREACVERLFFLCQSGLRRAYRDLSTPQKPPACPRLTCSRRPRATAATSLPREDTRASQGLPWPGPAPPSAPPGPGSSQRRPTHPATGAPTPATAPCSACGPSPLGEAQPATGPRGQAAVGSEAPAPGPPPAGEAVLSSAGSHAPAPTPGAFAAEPVDAAVQALEELLDQFGRAVGPAAGRRPALERAARDLQRVTSAPSQLSSTAQALAARTLLHLSAQLPKEPPTPSNVSGQDPSAAAQALFLVLGNLLEAADSSQGQRKVQGEGALQAALAALPLIQTGLLLGRPSAAVDSPVLSTTVSSCLAASLPGRSFHLPQPWPVRVMFPSATALAPLLRPHRHLQVQVASFALNPFRHLDGAAVGSVASVSLVANKEPLRILGLAEEIEVWLGGDAGEPAHLSGGAMHFSLEVETPPVGQALLLSVRPCIPVQLLLHLADRPAALLNTTLPRGPWQEEGAYAWVIPAEELRHGMGTVHISAEVTRPPRGSWNLSSSLVSAGCYHWAARQRAWRSDGCRVGPLSTPGSIQCLCSHLSFFGRIVLVLPHRICLRCTGQLLRRVGQNPAGVALLGSLLLAYGAVLLWVRRRQKDDAGKVKVTALADNAAGASYLYLVQVFTGHRRGAGTSAKVTLTLYGAEGRSEPHLLQHPEPPCLERGGVDAFLLATWAPLGELHAVRLWHSNTGPSPSWFVRRLVIRDLQARKTWHFLAGRWLAAELGDGQLDGVFAAASRRELLSFRRLFWDRLVEKLMQEHLWLSVVSCSPWSPFTRAQRLSCCFTLLLCSMLTSIMFWKEPPEDGSRPGPGPFAVTWQQLVVSAEAAVLLLPVNLLITRLFWLGQLPASGPPPRSTHGTQPAVPPRQTPLLAHIEQELTETLGFLYKNPLCRCRDTDGFPRTLMRLPELVSGLCGLIHSHLRHLEDSEAPPPEGSCHLLHYLCHVVNDLEAQLRALGGSSQPDPCDCLLAAGRLRKLRQRLAQQQQHAWPCGVEPRSCRRIRDTACLARPLSQAGGAPGQGAVVEPACPLHCCPSWRGLVSWGVLGATSLATAFFTGLYSLQMEKEQAARWAVTTLLSVLQNILLLQPLKVLALTALSALLHGREPWQDGGQEQQLQRQLGLLLERAPGRAPPCSRDCSSPLYRPPALTPSAPRTERAQQEEKLHFLLWEIVVQLLFLAVLMGLSYRERGPHEFYLNNALRKVFATELKDVRTLEQLYGWARQSLLPGIYSDVRGLAMDRNSFLVGSVRLRQIRARGAPWEPVPAVLALQQKLFMGSLDEVAGPAPRWGSPGTDRRTGDSPWEHQSESTLKEHPIWGKLALYPGSGYLADLGTNASHADSVLQYLEQNHWLDGNTRAVFVEFVVYNANINLFCAITLILETNGLGALLSTAELQILRLYPNSDALVQLACAHILFLLFVLYYIVVQGRQVKQRKLRYFSSKGSLLDAGVTLASVAAVGLYVKRSLLAHDLLRRHRQDRTRFISFQETVAVDSALTYLIAFLVALATVKLWKLLQLHSRMRLITETLRKGWDKGLGLLAVLLVLLTGYAIGCNLMFGWSIADYKTFFDSVVTVVGLLAGIFDYEEVIALDPVLGSAMIVTGVFSMVFVILNLFVSALLTIFSQEMKAAKARKEESVTRLLWLKISALLGVERRTAVVATPLGARD